MRHYHRPQYAHNNQHTSFRESRSDPPHRCGRPVNIHQKQLINKRQPDHRDECDNGTLDLFVRVGEKHNGDKKRCQHSPPYNRNIQQHFQCNGTAQDFRQRSGNGSQHRRSEYRTGYPFGSVFSGRFREAEPGDNPQVGNIMLKNDQHDSRQGDHPK